MTHDQFWNLITESRRDFDANRRDGNMDIQAERLEESLKALPAVEVADFEKHFTQFYFNAYRWDLWGAAYIIGGGCSDDGFTDFRYWLISMGREVFDSAMADPESLAEFASQPGIEACAFEEFGYIAGRILKTKAGTPPTLSPHPRDPVGHEWKEDQLPVLFPRLWAQFGDADA